MRYDYEGDIALDLGYIILSNKSSLNTLVESMLIAELPRQKKNTKNCHACVACTPNRARQMPLIV